MDKIRLFKNGKYFSKFLKILNLKWQKYYNSDTFFIKLSLPRGRRENIILIVTKLSDSAFIVKNYLGNTS